MHGKFTSEFTQVLDPRQAASPETELALRTNPVTAGATAVSDAVDIVIGGQEPEESVGVESAKQTAAEGAKGAAGPASDIVLSTIDPRNGSSDDNDGFGIPWLAIIFGGFALLLAVGEARGS